MAYDEDKKMHCITQLPLLTVGSGVMQYIPHLKWITAQPLSEADLEVAASYTSIQMPQGGYH